MVLWTTLTIYYHFNRDLRVIDARKSCDVVRTTHPRMYVFDSFCARSRLLPAQAVKMRSMEEEKAPLWGLV